MPTAPDYLRDAWDDTTATEYLESRGFKLTRDWEWIMPPNRNPASLTAKESDAIDYMIMEWDYGGLTSE